MGAGAVGCFVGGSLQLVGAEVHLVGRPRMLSALSSEGLTLTDLDGRRQTLAPSTLRLHESVPPDLHPGLVLLCVKSGATHATAAALGTVLPPGTPVLSLQNGIGNAGRGRDAAPSLHWLAGMVPFNLTELSPGHLHRGTSGMLAAQNDPSLQAWQPAFADAALPLALHADMQAVLWGKLLLNLNNPVNAVSGLPLKAQLMDRGYRRVLAALQTEALAVLKTAGIRPARVGGVAPTLLPWLLRLPDALFTRLAARMLRMDDQARSSMADDLALGRPTEVDALCGEVVRLAQVHGCKAPLNRGMVDLFLRAGSLPSGPAALHAALSST
jgi:2-dehydropantoate 2-reductase